MSGKIHVPSLFGMYRRIRPARSKATQERSGCTVKRTTDRRSTRIAHVHDVRRRPIDRVRDRTVLTTGPCRTVGCAPTEAPSHPHRVVVDFSHHRASEFSSFGGWVSTFMARARRAGKASNRRRTVEVYRRNVSSAVFFLRYLLLAPITNFGLSLLSLFSLTLEFLYLRFLFCRRTQTIGGYNLLTVEGVLFGVMTCGIVLTMRVVGELWRATGGAYNVDAVLSVMVSGLEEELNARMSGSKVYASSLKAPSAPRDRVDANAAERTTTTLNGGASSSKILPSSTAAAALPIQQQGANIGIAAIRIYNWIRRWWMQRQRHAAPNEFGNNKGRHK